MVLAAGVAVSAGQFDLICAFHVVHGTYVLTVRTDYFYMFLDFGCIYHN